MSGARLGRRGPERCPVDSRTAGGSVPNLLPSDPRDPADSISPRNGLDVSRESDRQVVASGIVVASATLEENVDQLRGEAIASFGWRLRSPLASIPPIERDGIGHDVARRGETGARAVAARHEVRELGMNRDAKPLLSLDRERAGRRREPRRTIRLDRRGRRHIRRRWRARVGDGSAHQHEHRPLMPSRMPGRAVTPTSS